MLNFRKYSTGIFTIISAAILVFLLPTGTKAATSFTDLEEGDTGYIETLSLVNQGIINGYSDGTFKPYKSITRQQVAVMLTNALHLETPANVDQVLAQFKDVDSDDLYAAQIAAVAESGVFKGSNGYFKPGSDITRSQMATVLVHAFDLEATNEEVDLKDLESIGSSHRENVKILAQHDISQGSLDKNGNRVFNGGQDLKRVQFAIFLDKTLALNTDNEQYLDGDDSEVRVILLHDMDYDMTFSKNDDFSVLLEGELSDSSAKKIIQYLHSTKLFGKNPEIIIGNAKVREGMDQKMRPVSSIHISFGENPNVTFDEKFGIPKDIIEYKNRKIPENHILVKVPSNFITSGTFMLPQPGEFSTLDLIFTGIENNLFSGATSDQVVKDEIITITRKDGTSIDVPVNKLTWDENARKMKLYLSDVQTISYDDSITISIKEGWLAEVGITMTSFLRE
ncbi:S-layer homology domain-containing protein [Radiobacillus deserti]|uniref:S-layer homology domain-containing protein n=1 Tax=Radiobacillus deserti TaxID=2594883 RepID=A0A516KJF4_9BACI|nr:S-layer homology domain-containing protein [Radiobacillus deserti]QDP41520.1 S-layer homology domain-containing protein [Radiobacillus deserti]